MRTFNFRARNIGEEKYLSYTMGEDCELDEDVLDYCQDNAPEELIEIIYEEDDDYDYLTYQITGKTSLEEYIAQLSRLAVMVIDKGYCLHRIHLCKRTV